MKFKIKSKYLKATCLENVLFLIIFSCSLFLRLSLAQYNREANDPHRPVIVYIMKNDSLPEKADCWECFQPKTFYYIVEKILSKMGLTNQATDRDAQKIAGQLINFFAGSIILIMSWSFIGKLTENIRTKLLCFALLAFNPQLIGINSQLTNDTFLFLFCVLTVYFAYSFLKESNAWVFLLIIIGSVLAVTTKTNGWVMVIAVSIAMFIKLFTQRSRRWRELTYLIVYLLSVPILVILDPMSQYIHNYKHYGTPFVLNMDRLPTPMFFKETYISDAGILSVQDGFFTFKLIDLIEHPITELQQEIDRSSSRTSLWTFLYGSGNSVHFENYPPSWRTDSKVILMVNRGIFILALLPVFLMLVGFILETSFAIKALFYRNGNLLKDVSFGLFVLLFIGYILFIALYAFEYRLYTFFKAIFIFPALLAFVMFFQRGLETALTFFKVKNWIIEIPIVALVLLYIFDVGSLILDLLPNGSGINVLLEALMSK